MQSGLPHLLRQPAPALDKLEPNMTAWTCALTLDTSRQTIAGSEIALTDAIRRGADLRVYTEFRHNQHIDTTSANDELVREVRQI